ncbi:MFS transporter [Actinoplanes philippinensis]|uniref:MFS transporter n=1 Tax=Actinoplanes philippinensis TaxID=35752 RepID=UPI0033F901F1
MSPSGSTLWRDRDYMSWWIGNGLSALGSSMSTLAYPLLVLYTTGSMAQAGVLMAVNLIGSQLTTLAGGGLADRISRRAIMIAGSLVQAGALGAVAWLARGGPVPMPALSAAAAVSGLASGLTVGVSAPVLRRLVGTDRIGQATAQGLGRDLTARLLGSPLGGALFAVARWLPFLADAISFLLAALGVALIRKPLGPDRADRERRVPVTAGIATGVRLVLRHPYLRFTVVWGALLNAAAQGFFVLLIALVHYRGGGPATIGVVNAIALLGGVLGAIAGPLALRRFTARRILLAAVWVFAMSFAAVTVVPRPWQIGAVLLVAMTAMVPLNVVLEAYEVRLVPDSYSGRVTAVTRFGMQSIQWAGPLIAGVLADRHGVRAAILVPLTLVAVLAVALHLSRSTLAILDGPLARVPELVPAELLAAPGRKLPGSPASSAPALPDPPAVPVSSLVDPPSRP